MYRAYKYSLQPTVTQERRLLDCLRLLRELYNAALEERTNSYRITGKSPSLFDQSECLPEIRELRPEFNSVSITVLRGTLGMLDKSFNAFFRRCKSGEKPGYPRFKNRHRFNTISINDLASTKLVVAGGRRVAVPIIGKIRFKQHRPINGTPKALRITRCNGKWFVIFLCADVPTKPFVSIGRTVGIDLGITSLVATSDGEIFENPHAFKSAKILLAKADRRVSRRKKGSNRRRKAVRFLAKKHAHVANIRRESAIKIAKSLVAKYDTIFVENLNVKGLASGILAKSVNDAAWGIHLYWLHVKAEEAGREVVKVDPRGTSQECSGCGETVAKDLSVRIHNCPHCGLVIDRDINAAINVKTRGLRVRGGSAGSQPPMIREASTGAAGTGASCEL